MKVFKFLISTIICPAAAGWYLQNIVSGKPDPILNWIIFLICSLFSIACFVHELRQK